MLTDLSLLSKGEISKLSKAELALRLTSALQHSHMLKSVSELIRELTETDSLNQLFNVLVEKIPLTTTVFSCGFYFCDVENFKLVAKSNEFSRSFDSPYDLPTTVLECIDQEETILSSSENDKLAQLAIPIWDGESILAILLCYHTEMQFFDPLRLDMFQTLAQSMVGLIRNRRLYEQTQSSLAALEYAENLQRSLFSIASLTCESNDMVSTYSQLHKAVGTIVNADNFFIAIYDEEKDSIHFPYIVDRKTPISPSEHYPAEALESSLSGWVIKHNKPLLLSTRDEIIAKTSTGNCQLVGEIAESWLGVPFRATEDIRGVVVIQTYESGRTYSDADKELMHFVSQHIGIALGRVLVEQKLQYRATHDALTDLPNRLLFNDRLKHAFQQMKRRDNELIALLYIDLDKFKTINDTFGHLFGDKFLVSVSNVIGKCIRDCDTLARLGGDEFSILLEGLSSREEALIIASRINDSMAKPLSVDGSSVSTSSSIGIAFPHDNTFSAEDLVADADAAMYQAKLAGRGNYKVFRPSDIAEQPELISLEDELAEALAHGQFVLHYQPIMQLSTGQFGSMEALIRWQHPKHGLIYPKEFLDFADDAGLMTEIDRWVLEQVIVFASSSSFTGQVSVNLSEQFIESVSGVSFINELLQQAKLNSSRLVVEISERTLSKQENGVSRFIHEINALGVGVTLDDFGSGFASLNYLNDLDLKAIKIDQSIIDLIESDKGVESTIKSMISLKDTLQVDIIAECIETEEQKKMLITLGCPYGQGYLLAEPNEANEITSMLSKI